ncbi:MAG: hypothetical protein ACI9IA_000198 [Enterobacterales bacterium]|jgi:hypothetical protein
MTKLTLIPNTLTNEERIQARIDSFARDIMNGEGNMEYIEQILRIVHEYLIDFEDEDLVLSTFRLKECIFYIQHFSTT